MRLSVAHDFLPKSNTVRAAQVMQHFGIDFEHGKQVIAEGLDLPLAAGQIVLFTGDSGSGKSSLMRETAVRLRDQGASVVNVDDLDLGRELLIDRLDTDLDGALKLLAACGLGEAQLMLRSPAELSEGQRYRFRLALALSQSPQWLLADEFTATLDRTLARVISANLRKVADRTGTGFLLATTHADLLADLDPDLHVECRLAGCVQVRRREDADRKKKAPVSPTNSGSPRVPDPTGRTSLGGIIAATKSPSFAT